MVTVRVRIVAVVAVLLAVGSWGGVFAARDHDGGGLHELSEPVASVAPTGPLVVGTRSDGSECVADGGLVLGCAYVTVAQVAESDPAAALVLIDGFLAFPEGGEACHELVHVAGRSAATVMSFSEAARLGDARLCVDGFLHGVAEASFPGLAVEEITGRLLEVCGPAADVDVEFVDICAHGAGHALVGATSALSAALDSCVAVAATLVDDPVRGSRTVAESCADGVFMSWTEQRARWSDGMSGDVSVLDTCQRVDVVVQEPCYLYVGFLWGPGLGYDVETMVVRCETEPLPRVCAQGVGRTAATLTDLDLVEVARRCRAAGDVVAGACVRGATEYVYTQMRAGQRPDGDGVCAGLGSSWALVECEAAVAAIDSRRSVLG